jgi:hypothetical protein
MADSVKASYMQVASRQEFPSAAEGIYPAQIQGSAQ